MPGCWGWLSMCCYVVAKVLLVVGIVRVFSVGLLTDEKLCCSSLSINFLPVLSSTMQIF